jgi:hypothetical protein
MRKFILYFLLLPFFGFGQIVDLVKWNGTTVTTPTTITSPNAVNAGNITAGKNTTLNAVDYEGFKAYPWPTSFVKDENKYIQFTISAKPGFKLKLSSFDFTYKANPNVKQYEVRYSKDDFKTSTLLLNEVASSEKTNKSISLANISLQDKETLYIRIYGYKVPINGWLDAPLFLMNSHTIKEAGNTTPTIKGSIIPYDKKDINANDDNVTTDEERSITVNVLSNDTKGSSPISGLSIASSPSPSEGTVIINPDNSITFQPASGFTGETSFSYTIKNNTKSSTGTVFVTVLPLSPGLVIWNGASQKTAPAVSDSNITASDITVNGMDFGTNYGNFRINSIPSAINYAKYIQFSIEPKAGYKIALTELKFRYNSATKNGPKKYQVRFSTDSSFPSNGTILADANTILDKTTDATLTFPSGTVVLEKKPVYVRIYLYDAPQHYQDFSFIHDNGGTLGPTIVGIVSDVKTLTAISDSATTEMNQAIDIPILDNDIIGSEPLQNIVITKQPPSSEGTVIISSTKEATFTPAPNFTGTTSFTYTINNKKSYSSATVTVLVKEPLIKTVIWTGKRWKNGYPSANTDVIIEGNYDSKTRLLESYEILANVNKLIIKSKIQVTINEGETLIINNNIVNDGSLIIKNAGALVQTNDNASYTGSMGSFEMERITKAMYSTDYTYWSSPLTTDSKFTLKMLSPNSTGNRYYSYSTDKGWELNSSGSLEMKPGYGYIVRAPYNSNLDIKLPYTANFIGKPNNGITNVDVFTIGDYTTNLIGNPYPSAISADLFYEQNKALIKGTFYFWTHNTRISSVVGPNGQYNYSPSDYISYNATGATSSGDTAYCSTCGGEKMTGNIASGQSFFVQAKKSGKLTYNNAMRVKLNSKNNEFSRASKTEEKTITTIEKNRVWLNLKNDDGLYNETLLGYITGATNDLDEAYDGPSYSAGTAIYSILNNENLVIQGRALPFDENEVIPLGIITDAAGEYTIGIESMDGFFRNEKVFLTDKTTNITTNLKDSRYSFKSESGTFNDRFSLRFTQKTLGIDKPILAENGIIVYNQNKQIQVSSNDKNINSIMIYDILGKIIYKKDTINNTTFSTEELQVPDQIVIVKIKTEDNSIITKKIIL